MNYFRFIILLGSVLIIQSCRLGNRSATNAPRIYHHADIIYEHFCVLRNYSEDEYIMLESKEYYESEGQTLEVTDDSTLTSFSVKVDSVLNTPPSDEIWLRDIYIVAILEGDNVSDTIALTSFKNHGVYINDRYYADSSIAMSLMNLLDSKIQRF